MDVAFVVDEGVTHERLVQCMTSAGGKLLEDVRLFDVYRDEARVGAGKKSMAYALTYRAADRTLTSEEVDKAHEAPWSRRCPAPPAPKSAGRSALQARLALGLPSRAQARPCCPCVPSSNDGDAGGRRVVGMSMAVVY